MLAGMTDLGRFSVDSHRKNSPPPTVVAELARQQHGVVARWQLRELGFGEGLVEYWIRTGRLHRLFRGVYAVGHRALPKRGWELAAVLACGPEARLSHRHAADLWGVRATARRTIDVTTPRGRAGQRGIQVHRVRALDERDRAVKDGIPVTALARTYLDLAECLRPREVQRAIDEGDRLGIFDLKAIQDICARSPGRRGVPILIALCEQAEEPPLTRSEAERLFLDICEDHGIPRPAVNAVVEGLEVDMLWRSQRAIVEIDGYAFHRGRRAFERDPERDTILTLAGYRVIHITYKKLTREPAQVAERVFRLLAGSPSTTRS
jgi:Protein of unknown function (DUF559)/Transcriptional regulator, AbiEi antitoxin